MSAHGLPASTGLGHGLPRVGRLGLASRGNTNLDTASVHRAIAAGVNYLNWCGNPNGLSRAVRELGAKRKDVVVAAQLSATSRDGILRELDAALAELGTDWLDVPTYYWMESREQWRALTARDGGATALAEAKAQGRVRALGLTSHQRKLAAEIAQEGLVDVLMIRYNAAHTGAERDIFPVTGKLKLPVVAYTCLRWGALMSHTPDDPPDFEPPAAPAWYRWVLQNPSVSVALMAPDNAKELDEDLRILRDWRALSEADLCALSAHGKRVYKHAGAFP